MTDAPGPSLEVSGIEVVYHRAALAIQGVSLTVGPARIVALLGPNGAGKTTTLRAVSGFLGADDAAITRGTVVYDGRRLEGRAPHEIVRHGLVLVPEREKIFETLTVEENLATAVASRRAPGGPRQARQQVLEYFPVLAERRRQIAGYLSGGERQMLAIARALLCAPRLLLVDELSLGLAPLVAEHLLEIIARLRAELGVAILLVEENASAVLEIADYGYVIEHGRIVYEDTAARLREHTDIQEFYLGRARDGDRSYREVKQYRRKRRWHG
jgi:branched-chain amino acid transport system ATP-binding protein